MGLFTLYAQRTCWSWRVSLSIFFFEGKLGVSLFFPTNRIYWSENFFPLFSPFRQRQLFSYVTLRSFFNISFAASKIRNTGKKLYTRSHLSNIFFTNILLKVYSTSSYDSNKLTNNHSVKLQNKQVALIENFIKIENKMYVIIRDLQKESFKFKI